MARALNVLFVEDSTDDRDLLLLTLQRAGFDVRWRQVARAEELRAALANPGDDASAEPWDIVLCDYFLPDLRELEALEIVRAHDPDLPLIIVSGVLGEEAAVAAMKAGARDFFGKNRLARLGTAIEREVREAQIRRDKRKAEQERERLFQELQRALVVRDEFLVLASHEFRTPLTVLRLQVNVMSRLKRGRETAPTPIDDGAPAHLARLQGQVDRLEQMIDRLLDVTHLSSEPLRLVRSSTDLAALVAAVVERSRDWIDDARCSVSLEPMDEAVGAWDPVRLDTVITSLLSNALKYGAGGPVTLSVRREEAAAHLSVVDHGIGLSDEEQRGLFQKFARAAPNSNYGGLGVGLWIADQVVRAHGGSIEIQSRKGHGATFNVRLPLQQGP